VFLTNHTLSPTLTVCALYKSRWQAELFFKWIKQHLRIKRFYGTSEHAVKTQIWIAVCVYVLIAIIRKELNLNASMHTLLQILSVTLFEKTPLQQALGENTMAGSPSGFPAEQRSRSGPRFQEAPDIKKIAWVLLVEGCHKLSRIEVAEGCGSGLGDNDCLRAVCGDKMLRCAAFAPG
jgi:hypothetical protein